MRLSSVEVYKRAMKSSVIFPIVLFRLLRLPHPPLLDLRHLDTLNDPATPSICGPSSSSALRFSHFLQHYQLPCPPHPSPAAISQFATVSPKSERLKETRALIGSERLKETRARIGSEMRKETRAQIGREMLKETKARIGSEMLKETRARIGSEMRKETKAPIGRGKLKETRARIGSKDLNGLEDIPVGSTHSLVSSIRVWMFYLVFFRGFNHCL
jgi:hypothetical protein